MVRSCYQFRALGCGLLNPSLGVCAGCVILPSRYTSRRHLRQSAASLFTFTWARPWSAEVSPRLFVEKLPGLGRELITASGTSRSRKGRPPRNEAIQVGPADAAC